VLLGSYSFIFAAVQFYIPLTVVHTIYSSGPLLVNLLDYVINGAKLTKKQIIGAVVAFLGVLMIANGNLALSYFD
jgi:drug/metabolite transporter (DMT)-like permease